MVYLYIQLKNQYDALSEIVRRNKREVMCSKIVYNTLYKWSDIAVLEDIYL